MNQKKLEDKIARRLDNKGFYLVGGSIETFFQGLGLVNLIAVPITTYLSAKAFESSEEKEVSGREKFYYCTKNSAKALTGATIIAGLRYFF